MTLVVRRGAKTGPHPDVALAFLCVRVWTRKSVFFFFTANPTAGSHELAWDLTPTDTLWACWNGAEL